MTKPTDIQTDVAAGKAYQGATGPVMTQSGVTDGTTENGPRALSDADIGALMADMLAPKEKTKAEPPAPKTRGLDY